MSASKEKDELCSPPTSALPSMLNLAALIFSPRWRSLTKQVRTAKKEKKGAEERLCWILSPLTQTIILLHLENTHFRPLLVQDIIK